MPDSIFKAVFLIGFVAGSVIRKWYGRKHSQDTVTDQRSEGLAVYMLMFLWGVAQVIALTYVFSPWLDFANYHLPIWAGWVGVPVFAAALWLLWRSHADLGRNWSPFLQVVEAHSLVAEGAYRHVRHPMYAAHGLWGIAQALLLQNWIAGLGGLAAFIPVYVLRVPREEQMMLEHFGDEYRSYMNRTGRVIPRLWR